MKRHRTSSESTAHETYRDDLARLVHAMVNGYGEDVQPSLAADSNLDHVYLFLEGNLEKRFEKLSSALEFVAPAFDNFADLVEQFMVSQPLTAYDTGISDAERMLEWLETSHQLSPAQQDHVTCQRARHGVEELARQQRLTYLRFQERYSLIEQWSKEFDERSRLRLYLNPIRIWGTFVSGALLEETTLPPVQVLFFPRRGEIRSALLELEGQALVNELADFHPCTLTDWSAVSRIGDLKRLLETTRDLAEMGLVALG